MAFQYRTDVFYLSCVVFLCYVKSDTSCPDGWFGARCNYKCRCANDDCASNGGCKGSFTCEPGWFGPACQYVDLAYNTANDPQVVDGNDSTCTNAPGTHKLTLLFNDSTEFTWLRIIVKQGSPGLQYMLVTFFLDMTAVDCTVPKRHFVNDRTMDVHCNLTQHINQVTVDGDSVDQLCSVYISGGRNVALKEKATQQTTHVTLYNYNEFYMVADLAVDGKTNQDVFQLSCSHTAERVTVNDPIPTWTLSLSPPRSVHKYVIYNRVDDKLSRIVGFKLESFDRQNRSIFMYRDPDRKPRELYTIIHRPLEVGVISVSVTNEDLILTICEFEVYGDSVCEAQHYGRDCELTCNCPFGEACFVSTGGCPVCPDGFQGPGCLSKCSAGKFGHQCNSFCSGTCELFNDVNMSSCHHITGSCIRGCKSGFKGPNCEHESSTGSSITNDSLSCSPHCVASNETDESPCNQTSGACIMGCQSGFSGETCDSVTAASQVSLEVNIHIIIGVSLAVAAVLIMGFCARRKLSPGEEESRITSSDEKSDSQLS